MTRSRTNDAVASLTWRQALAWRLHRQHLVRRAGPGSVVAIARDLRGLHAQVMSSAELTVWARSEELRRDEVAGALWEERSLVKLWAMRGTLHLVPADDFGGFVGALRTYDHFLKPQWLKYFAISREDLERMLDATRDVLAGRELTREELAAEVEKETRSTEIGDRLRASWGSFLKPSSFRGDLCFAPSRGRNVTFTRPDTWIGRFEVRDPKGSVARMVRDFLHTYGPAAREDVARWWGGFSPAGAERVMRGLDDAVAVDVEGTRRWMLAQDVESASDAAPGKVVNLLPAFDQYVVTAPRDNPAVLDPALKERVYRKAAWLSQVLLADGRMVGVWNHERKGRRLDVAIEPFARVPVWVKKGAEREAERLAAYLGGELSLTWSE